MGNILFAGCVIVLLFNTGCVRRRLTVRTSPPGALVSVDNQVIGTTPAASTFIYYAPRDIRVEKEGFATQTIRHRIDPPWYQYPPFDFITETLWPGEIRDERVVDLQLTPETVEPVGAVVGRADQLRTQSRQGVIPSVGNRPIPETTLSPATNVPVPQALPAEAPAYPNRLPPGGLPYQ